MKVRYYDEMKKFDFIDNYQQFLEKCYKEFDMSEKEKKSLKIFILDDGDEIMIENEGDFDENKSLFNDNICILKSSGRKPKNKKENKEELKAIEKKEEKIKKKQKTQKKKMNKIKKK